MAVAVGVVRAGARQIAARAARVAVLVDAVTADLGRARVDSGIGVVAVVAAAVTADVAVTIEVTARRLLEVRPQVGVSAAAS